MPKTGLILLLLAVIACQSPKNGLDPKAVDTTPRPPLPETTPLKPALAAVIDFEAINESSGIVKSRQWENIYWTHNDFGDFDARIYPIQKNGAIAATRFEGYAGVALLDAVNIDWEDIATDNAGHLYLAACGNNFNTRRDLAVYVLNEPFPHTTTATRIMKKIQFHYPEQKTIPSEQQDFDAEALFWANEKIYLLTKHRSDGNTSLYRLDVTTPEVSNPATLIGRFEIGRMVTGADATPDGSRLAVLTYGDVWLFEKPADSDNYFKGRISWRPIELPKDSSQCEAICFDGEELVITTEQRGIFRIAVNDLIKLESPS